MQVPKIELKMPEGAVTAGLPTLAAGMQSWRNARNGFIVVTAPFTADPDKNNTEWYGEACRGLREDQIRRELLIDFTARGGQKVFPYLEQFPKKFQVNPWAEIPKNYDIVCGMDFGGRNPTAIIWFAVNERGHFHAFSEFYKPSTPPEIARYLKAHPYYHRLQKIAVDPSVFNKNQHHFTEKWEVITSIGDMLNDLGIYQLERGNNDRVAGLERLKYMFRHSESNPSLDAYFTISKDCPNLWKELTSILYKDESPEQLVNKNPSEDTVKKGDHAFDATKYGLLSWSVPAALADKPKAHMFSLHQIEEDIDAMLDKENLEGLLI